MANKKLAELLRGKEDRQPAGQNINVNISLNMGGFAEMLRMMAMKNKENEDEYEKVDGLTPSVSG